MLDTFRRRQRTLLMIITVVVIVAFAWLYNPASFRRLSVGQLGKLNGRTVTIDDVRRLNREQFLAGQAGLYTLASDLITQGRTQDERALSFAWNLLLLRDEAKSLQIEPNADQIREAEKKLPPFQENGQFAGAKYQQFVDQTLKPDGLTAADLDDVVRDQLRLEAIVQFIAGTAKLPESFFREHYEAQNGKMRLAVINLNRADFEKNIQISDDEINKYYNEQKLHLVSAEKRSIVYVVLPLNDEQKKLTGEARNQAFKPLADQAEIFAQAVLEHPDQFTETARQKGLPTKESALFTEANPDPALSDEPAVARQAFSVTPDNPVSDVIQGANGLFVIKLQKVEPSRPLTLAEAHDQIVSSLKDERVRTAMETRAKELRTSIQESLKGGLDVAQAAEKAGVKPDFPAPFSFAEPGANEELARTLQAEDLNLEPGETSRLLTAQGNGLLVHLLGREPLDEKKFEQEKSERFPQMNAQFSSVMFQEWLKTEQVKAGAPPA